MRREAMLDQRKVTFEILIKEVNDPVADAWHAPVRAIRAGAVHGFIHWVVPATEAQPGEGGTIGYTVLTYADSPNQIQGLAYGLTGVPYSRRVQMNLTPHDLTGLADGDEVPLVWVPGPPTGQPPVTCSIWVSRPRW